MQSIHKVNRLLYTDSYKIGHWGQYPPGTQVVHSYLEPRSGAEYEDIVWFGLQYYLKEYGFCKAFADSFDYQLAQDILSMHFGFDYLNPQWDEIISERGSKKWGLPIRIRSLPEGSIVKPGTPVLAVENMDERYPWLTNYFESVLMHVYSASTTATISYAIYKTVKKWCDKTGDKVLPVHLNDFGLRGASSLQTAEACGIAHLTSFIGTDNLPAIYKAYQYYGHECAGVSVKAAEHSTITSWGDRRELDAYTHIISTAPNAAIVSIVCDSYDWQYAVQEYFCKLLKDLILSREGKTVVRPDSGYPPSVTLEILEMLWAAYGGTINAAGYKVLNPKIGVIYGDGIDVAMIDKIMEAVVGAKFSPLNVIFGCGGTLLQNYTRDTNSFAMKCSCIKINGEWQKVKKTTLGKESKAGLMDHLPIVYEDGELVVNENLWDIRKRVGVLDMSDQ